MKKWTRKQKMLKMQNVQKWKNTQNKNKYIVYIYIMKKNAQIIIFDDTCIFCIKAVNFIIKRDKNKIFYFAGFTVKVQKS